MIAVSIVPHGVLKWYYSITTEFIHSFYYFCYIFCFQKVVLACVVVAVVVVKSIEFPF